MATGAVRDLHPYWIATFAFAEALVNVQRRLRAATRSDLERVLTRVTNRKPGQKLAA